MSALTEFDREVLSILLSSGGWNASSRSRLAQLARRYGVSAAGLSRVVSGLALAAKNGRLQRIIEEESRHLRPGHPHEPGASSRRAEVMPSRSDGRTESRPLSRGDRILMGVVGGLLALSASLAVTLVAMIWGAVEARAPRADASPSHARSEDGASRTGEGVAGAGWGAGEVDERGAGPAASRAGAGARSAATPGDPATERPPAVTVSYPRVPSFRALLASADLDRALAQARGAAMALETIARESLGDPEVRRHWSRTQEAVGRAWPRLDAVMQRAILERTIAIVRRIEDSETAAALIEPFRDATIASPARVGEIWQGAWSAGVLGAILSEPGLAPEVVAVVASLRLAPADGSGEAFDRFAAGWLDRQLPALLDLVRHGSPQEDFNRFEAWIVAQERVRPRDEAQVAWLQAMDALLHRPLRFDLPGVASDVLGRFAGMIDWQGGGRVGASIAGRFRKWLGDPAIPSPHLWALGSILRQSGSAPWFDATMVVGERATPSDRAAALARILAALGDAPAAIEPLARLPRELVARWDRLSQTLLAADESAGPVVSVEGPKGPWRSVGEGISEGALRDSALLLRLMDQGAVGSLLAAGRSAEAAQRLAEIESARDQPLLAGLGHGGRALPSRVEPTADGALARRLDEARATGDRVEAIRRRRTEAASDLGPIDAARLVREAYTGEPNAVRLTAQGVIVDSFGSGPRVAQELVDQFVLTGGADPALARFIERLTGERMPPHTHPAFRSKALAALLRNRLRLSEHPWHGVEALMARAAASAADRLEAEGGSPESLRDATEPTDALVALADLLRARAEARITLQPFPDSLERLDRRDAARRALAMDAGQALVAALWRVMELELFLAAAERPGLREPLGAILERARHEASTASTVLAQAIAIERGRLRLVGLRLAQDSGALP